ncbi:MAG: hypothetical protein JJ878_16735 [Alphaproteobacteria bacterium]|jgi:hypothetical protein|nr:hypothetical protein [Alphaproteobacteria bacterium]MBO6864282.1 hypothetical protein [Alphaproteobacteria bacterium]
MSDAVTAAEEAYFKARRSCRAVMLDRATTEAEKREASRRRERIAGAYAQTVLDEFYSRTNMMGAIIAELQALKASITSGSAAQSLDTLTQVLQEITAALEKDKTDNGG